MPKAVITSDRKMTEISTGLASGFRRSLCEISLAAIHVQTVSVSQISGEAFLTQPGPFVDLVRSVVTQETNRQPVLSTTGGTSDARFIKNHCPVVEFGLVGAYMHQVDERVPVAQVQQLKTISAIKDMENRAPKKNKISKASEYQEKIQEEVKKKYKLAEIKEYLDNISTILAGYKVQPK